MVFQLMAHISEDKIVKQYKIFPIKYKQELMGEGIVFKFHHQAKLKIPLLLDIILKKQRKNKLCGNKMMNNNKFRKIKIKQ